MSLLGGITGGGGLLKNVTGAFEGLTSGNLGKFAENAAPIALAVATGGSSSLLTSGFGSGAASAALGALGGQSGFDIASLAGGGFPSLG